MLSTMRNSWLLYALFAICALSSAMSIEEAIRNLDGIEAYLHHGMNRRAGGTGSTPSSTPAPSSASPTPTPTPTPTPSSDGNTPTPTPSQTPDQTSAAPTSNAAPSSDSPSQSQAQSSNAPASSAGRASTSAGNNQASSTQAAKSSTITTPVIHTTPLVATSYQSYLTVYTTISDGQQVAVTSVASSAALITTGTAVSTETPLPQSGSGGSGHGLSDTNKKVVGGVIGGIGGAILLGGLAIVAWRIWGRKKRVSEDDDDLMAGTGSALGDKPNSAGNNHAPFQSNLEQYHNPGGRPNAAANF